jgi:ribosomal protein S18 acetylase RimI-like enzyme
MLIRSFERADYDAWLALWNANCLNQISDDITGETWRRITTAQETVFGLGSFDENGKLCGILHYILHPTTGFKEPACYMQDLYTASKCRRQGIAKQLVLELNAIGQAQKWARIYWFAENGNESVQSLYKNLGISMDFTLFMLQTQN